MLGAKAARKLPIVHEGVEYDSDGESVLSAEQRSEAAAVVAQRRAAGLAAPLQIARRPSPATRSTVLTTLTTSNNTKGRPSCLFCLLQRVPEGLTRALRIAQTTWCWLLSIPAAAPT